MTNLFSKKVLSLFLSLVMLFTTLAVGIIPASASVEKGEVWHAIKDKSDFDNIRLHTDWNYYLAEDIEFDERDFITSGNFNGGLYSISSFTGKLDGRGHSVVNLRLNGTSFLGNNNGLVQNIIFRGTYNSSSNTSFNIDLINYNYGEINNLHIVECKKFDDIACYNEFNSSILNCTIKDTDAVICISNNGTIDGCINFANITKSYGICNSNSGIISNTMFNGSISSSTAGYGIASSNKGVIENCINNGNITLTSSYSNCYGISSSTGSGYIKNCINRGKLTGYYVYGLGSNAQDSVNDGSYTLVGSGTAYGIGSNLYNCYCLNTAYSTTTNSGKPCTSTQLSNPSTYDSYIDFNNVWQIKNNRVGLQIENRKDIIVTPYYFPDDTDYLLNEEIDTSDLLLFKFDNYGDYSVVADEEYNVVGSTSKLGSSKVEIVTDFDTFYYYIDVYDKIDNQNITFDTTSCYVYNGQAITPNVVVKTQDGVQLIKNKDYSLAFDSNIYPGKAVAIITGLGYYSGSKKLYYTILPQKIAGLKVTDRTDSSISLSWAKQTGVTGYTVQKYNPSTSKWTNVKTLSSNTNSAVITGLNSCHEYKFRVAAYVNVDGAKKYGAYSSSISKYTTPKKSSITSLSKKTVGFSVKWSKVTNASGYEVQYATNKGFSNNKKLYTNKNTTSKTVTGLKANTTYYVRVRSYKTVNKTKVYSKWSSVKSVKTPIVVSTPKVTAYYLNSSQTKTTTKWTKVKGASGYQVCYGHSFYDYETGNRVMYWRLTKTVKGGNKTSLVSVFNNDICVRVRAYKIINGITYYGNWSKTFY